jgi:hypothetical protein
MTASQRRAYAAQIKYLTNHGRHLEAHALWIRTIAPKAARV